MNKTATNGDINGHHVNGSLKNGGTNGHDEHHANGGSYLIEEHMNINALINKEFKYEKIDEIAKWLLSRTDARPKIGVVCGSGLGGLADKIENAKIFPYNTIPNFPVSTVPGHKGNLIFGKLDGVEVVCMQGRFHAYEGYANAICTLPMRVFKLLGIETVLLTCAAGGLNEKFKLGDLMVIKDHLALPVWTLQHPLVGENDERFGPRFPPTNRLYTKSLRDKFHQVAKDLQIDLQEGVYVVYGGPSYETVSELRAFRILGGDAVGMSIAQEAIVAGHCGMKVFAIALITNICVTDYDSVQEPNHLEVVEMANKRAKDIENLVVNFIKHV